MAGKFSLKKFSDIDLNDSEPGTTLTFENGTTLSKQDDGTWTILAQNQGDMPTEGYTYAAREPVEDVSYFYEPNHDGEYAYRYRVYDNGSLEPPIP